MPSSVPVKVYAYDPALSQIIKSQISHNVTYRQTAPEDFHDTWKFQTIGW